ncbi:MAG: hypothetical protein CBE00_00535 [Planctomycetaceae bacterium TMED240]|nr:hypothetical protein [Rhodopirellula sp.]OUX08894.1 MAG: hypothetical protein CBE00_00535 [Planctomycetaceae bacterium TMED240]
MVIRFFCSSGNTGRKQPAAQVAEVCKFNASTCSDAIGSTILSQASIGSPAEFNSCGYQRFAKFEYILILLHFNTGSPHRGDIRIHGMMLQSRLETAEHCQHLIKILSPATVPFDGHK